MFELLQKLPDCEHVTKEYLIGWLDGDEREELTIPNIVNLATMDTMEEDDNTNNETAELHKISHNEDRHVLEKACLDNSNNTDLR
ncbi:hypothetical protein Trydic_g9670 [Trypoxylus dichotomus]